MIIQPGGFPAAVWEATSGTDFAHGGLSGYQFGVGTTRQTFGGDYGPNTYNVGDTWGGRQV